MVEASLETISNQGAAAFLVLESLLSQRLTDQLRGGFFSIETIDWRDWDAHELRLPKT